MRIYIPTLGRGPEKQLTVHSLGEKLVDRYNVTIVCHPDDALDMATDDSLFGAEVVPFDEPGIAPKRQFILEHSDDPLVMMLDDDLGQWSWRPRFGILHSEASPEQIAECFETVERLLRDYTHVGIGHRELSNQRHDLATNSRNLRALGFNRDTLADKGITFRLPVMEDLDVQLQILRAGEPTVQWNKVIQGQAASNTAGGCSTYRTAEVQEKSARMLAELHPGFVQVVQKTSNSSDPMWANRTDVKISWAKAYQSGKELLDLL